MGMPTEGAAIKSARLSMLRLREKKAREGAGQYGGGGRWVGKNRRREGAHRPCEARQVSQGVAGGALQLQLRHGSGAERGAVPVEQRRHLEERERGGEAVRGCGGATGRSWDVSGTCGALQKLRKLQ